MTESLKGELEGFAYPHEVKRFGFASQGKVAISSDA